MVEKKVVITHSQDHEFELATMIVQLASRYQSRISILLGNKRVNAKSIMGMMSLGLMEEDEVTIIAEGDDESEAIECLTKLLHQ
ncbi:MAG: HPr family phosphocarrier protein [Lachnospiraceae bacterium]|nr:HPr family phosphocarrier protein [Lachnospiraceae bacterium]